LDLFFFVIATAELWKGCWVWRKLQSNRTNKELKAENRQNSHS